MKQYYRPDIEILDIEVETILETSFNINGSHDLSDGPFDLDM